MAEITAGPHVIAAAAGADVPAGVLRVVVTHLEMTAPPTLPLAPPPTTKLALVRAERPTVSFYRYLYDTVGERWLWVERRRLPDAALAKIIDDPRVLVLVLYAAGVPAGFAELDRRRPPDVELVYLGLMPEFIGNGLGSFLLSRAVAAAWSSGTRRLTVSTCSLDHPKALPLYRRLGFVPVRQAVKLWPDPRVSGEMPAHAGPQHRSVTA